MSAMRNLVLCLLAVGLNGCLLVEDFDDAEQSVAAFHEYLNREAYDKIWDMTAPAFREPQVRADARALFSAMHDRLGPALESEQIDASAYASANEGATVTLVYHTTFERGRATETFVFAMESGKPLIWNYNISSDAFAEGNPKRLADSGG